MMPDSEAFVPGIWSLEIANVLLVAERRNRMTQEQSEEADEDCYTIPIPTRGDI